MITNLDIARKYFPDAKFTENDEYDLNDYVIIWLEEEKFTVDKYFYDNEIGYVTDPDIFIGDFRQCLEFCLGYKLDAADVKDLDLAKIG